ncbi:hypothetical protein, partial [Enterobacter hormaechei]
LPDQERVRSGALTPTLSHREWDKTLKTVTDVSVFGFPFSAISATGFVSASGLSSVSYTQIRAHHTVN